MEATLNPTFKNSFHQIRNNWSKTIKNAKSFFVQRINNYIASCQAGSHSFWSMVKVVSQNFCQSSFPPLKNSSDSSSTTPSSKANLFASVFASNSNLNGQVFQPHRFCLQNSLCHPLSSPHEKSAKPFSSLTRPNPKALMVFQRQFSKSVRLNFSLFFTNYFSFPTLWTHCLPLGNQPMSFRSQK